MQNYSKQPTPSSTTAPLAITTIVATTTRHNHHHHKSQHHHCSNQNPSHTQTQDRWPTPHAPHRTKTTTTNHSKKSTTKPPSPPPQNPPPTHPDLNPNQNPPPWFEDNTIKPKIEPNLSHHRRFQRRNQIESQPQSTKSDQQHPSIGANLNHDPRSTTTTIHRWEEGERTDEKRKKKPHNHADLPSTPMPTPAKSITHTTTAESTIKSQTKKKTIAIEIGLPWCFGLGFVREGGRSSSKGRGREREQRSGWRLSEQEWETEERQGKEKEKNNKKRKRAAQNKKII